MIGDTESLLQHVIFMSYSKLMRDEDFIDTINSDYIILDELHRCGAQEWSRQMDLSVFLQSICLVKMANI